MSNFVGRHRLLARRKTLETRAAKIKKEIQELGEWVQLQRDTMLDMLNDIQNTIDDVDAVVHKNDSKQVTKTEYNSSPDGFIRRPYRAKSSRHD